MYKTLCIMDIDFFKASERMTRYVNDEEKKGWIPLGGPAAVASGPRNETFYIMQAMIKKTE